MAAELPRDSRPQPGARSSGSSAVGTKEDKPKDGFVNARDKPKHTEWLLIELLREFLRECSMPIVKHETQQIASDFHRLSHVYTERRSMRHGVPLN